MRSKVKIFIPAFLFVDAIIDLLSKASGLKVAIAITSFVWLIAEIIGIKVRN